MCKDSSLTYFQTNKERLNKKRLRKGIKILPKQNKKKSANIVVDD